MDTKNTFKAHFFVGLISISLISIFRFLLDVTWPASFARTAVILLFLVLIIGPMTKLSKSIKDASMIINPSSCRGELGIWFLLLGTGHFILLLTQRSIFSFINIGGGGYALANLLGLIGLFLALLLAATSFRKVISYIGGDLWRWLHSLTHAIFYLIAGHYLYFQFFSASRENGADWFGYLAVVMILIVVVLQLVTFFVELKRRRAKINEVMVSIQSEKMLDI